MSTFSFFRWLHILAGAGWLGEVIVIVFVLVPIISKLSAKEQPGYIAEIFPRMFRLASVLAGLSLVAGAVINYQLTGWVNLGPYISSFRGGAIALGGLLGLALALFHFFFEIRIESRVAGLATTLDDEELARLQRYLTLIPRVGLLVLLAIFMLMMVGARGL